MSGFLEVAPQTFVLRYPILDVNATLLVGADAAAIIDTLSTAEQARHLLDLIRAITRLPLVVINTHHHFDHTFGNATLTRDDPAPTIWGHDAVARALADEGSRLRQAARENFLDNAPEFAAQIAAVEVVAPTHRVTQQSIVDLGGRHLELLYFGHGHTNGDIVVADPANRVVLVGDLVEEGAPPSFDDGYPIAWPRTLGAATRLIDPETVVIPGHGACVDAGFVAAQLAELTELANLIRVGHAEGTPAARLASQATWPVQTATIAIQRGYAELAAARQAAASPAAG